MNQPALQQSHNDFNDLPVGEILRRTRLHYKRSIEDVEAALCIQAKQLHAIETGDTAALPARVYALGFVRSYAEYLGLDSEKIIELFKEQSGEPKPEPKPEPVQIKERKNSPPLWMAGVFLALACIALFVIFGGDEAAPVAKEPDIVPEVPTELKVEALEEKQKLAVTKPKAEEPKPEPEQPKGIVLKMVNDSWVEIRDENRRKLISRVLKKGDQYFVPDRLGLTISIGNAGGVEILVDGTPLDNLGVKGQVLRNIPLNADALKARFPKAVENPAENQ